MLDVCVVVVTLNHKDFVGTCVESIMTSLFPGTLALFAVDDGFVDGTKEFLKIYAPKLTLISREGNHSYANNCNTVLKCVEAKYYLVLNPDTVLPEMAVAALYDFMESHPQAGACGPKLIYPDGTLQLSCRRFPDLSSFLLRRTPIRNVLPERLRSKRHLMADWDHCSINQVDWVLGACLMLRGEALKQVGYFDEQFRLYCEDIDLCYRLWKNGWSVYYNPEIVVIHDHQAKSDRSLLSWYSFYHYQRMLY